MKFNYYLPANIIFGRGGVDEIGNITLKHGTKALVVIGGKSAKKSGLLERIIDRLQKAGVEAVVFDQVPQNPLTETALKGVEVLHENNCNIVIGVGGGSVMDCAKAIAFLSLNPDDINNYIFNNVASNRGLPIILVPTTCGTGSEGNGFAVLTNPVNGDKKALRSEAMIPKASIVDSQLMESMPKAVLAAVGFDALCHCMEAYLANNHQPITDMLSLSGIELIKRNLVLLYQGATEGDMWDELTWASTLGGMAINTAGVTLPHAMEHPVSGLRDIVHGQGLAALTPTITQASIKTAPKRYARISQCLGGKNEKDCVERILQLLTSLKMPTSLAELGIEASDIPWLTKNCLRVSAAGIKNHPVSFNARDISDLYRRAL